jgi:hypothetical protein
VCVWHTHATKRRKWYDIWIWIINFLTIYGIIKT